MSTPAATPQRADDVRVGIPLRAFLRFSRRLDEQLEELETRVFALVPQLARRRPARGTSAQRR